VVKNRQPKSSLEQAWMESLNKSLYKKQNSQAPGKQTRKETLKESRKDRGVQTVGVYKTTKRKTGIGDKDRTEAWGSQE